MTLRNTFNQVLGFKMLALVLAFVASMFCVSAEAMTLHTEANVMVEMILRAAKNYSDPFNEVTLDVVFVDPAGRELRVPAFWDGSNVWKARYSSPIVGRHTFRSECSNVHDAGLNGITGNVMVKPYTGANPLYIHGPLQVSENHRYLQYHDGTPFFWLGDTWWMGLSHRMHWPEDIKKLAADRKEKGFNVIQIVAGLYPDMFAFDPRGANEAGYPWETNYTRINPKYFDAADVRLEYLVDQGFTPCLVGAWGYFMPWMGVDKMKQHWRYLIARYGAMPMVWCAAGEANLPWYLAKGFPYDDRQQVHDWTEVMRYIRATDPFHHLLTIHPTGIGRLSARHATDDSGLLDIDALQTPHGERDAVAPTVHTVRQSYADKPVMPVIDIEASYEMLNNQIHAEWTRQMFWLCLMNGAAGHTYGANGIWQVNRRNDPHGKSPHGGNYGTIPWDDAMNLPGSGQVGLGKKFLEQYPWQQFQPHPEWAQFAREGKLSMRECSWIWYPEGNPAKDAPVAKRFFRRIFVVPEERTVERAALRVLADDRFEARLNGQIVGNGTDWQNGKQFDSIAKWLKPGTNILEITGENLPYNGPNPASIAVALKVDYKNGKPLKIISDDAWESSKTDDVGASWTKVLVTGKYGDAPWVPIDESIANDSAYGPQSSGIPGVVRIIYVPKSEDIVVRNLDARVEYRAAYFDPVTGAKATFGLIKSDNGGSWTCHPPEGLNRDWVLILEEQKTASRASNDRKQISLSNDALTWNLDWSDGRLMRRRDGKSAACISSVTRQSLLK
jgi:hypothetical protein